MKKFFTIGYEGAALDDFVETLLSVGVDHLIDVRELAISRRKGFAKTALSTALEAAGIQYTHLKGLGDPKPGREAARSGNYNLFQKVFMDHLKTEIAQSHLNTAIGLIAKDRACLMCYERNPIQCHRKIVSDQICDKIDAEFQHLGVQIGISAIRNPVSRNREIVGTG